MVTEQQRKKYEELKLRRQKAIVLEEFPTPRYDSSNSKTSHTAANSGVTSASMPNPSGLTINKSPKLPDDSVGKSMIEEFCRTKKRFLSDDPMHQAEYESIILSEPIRSRKLTLEMHLNLAIEQCHYKEADRLNGELMELENQITQAQFRSFGEQVLDQQKVITVTTWGGVRIQSNHICFNASL
jgi:hypothetical protein